MPLPYPDENCYSVLCRFAVRRGGWLNTHQVCREVFGHDAPMSGYLFKPFKTGDIEKWRTFGYDIHYGRDHSCYPYLSVFLGRNDRERLECCERGSVLTSGQAKSISQRAGLKKIRKKHLWYCLECVREDFRTQGETCWRRTPQMPGVSYCPKHGTRLKESPVLIDELDYRLIPASYAITYMGETGESPCGNVFENEFLQIARDTEWLLQHGFEFPAYDGVMKAINAISHGRTFTRLYATQEEHDGQIEFENYLASRVMKDMDTDGVNEYLRRYLGLILGLEKYFGGAEAFCR